MFKRWSPKALLCCVSKGTLILVTVAAGIAGVIAAVAALPHTPHEPTPPGVMDYVIVGVVVFGFVGIMLSLICSANITYCQVAVETRRRPWYWLPKRFGGDPLPAREMRKCKEGGAGREETDAEYRTRLGLPAEPQRA